MDERGFTLIEFVLVIIVAAIIAAVAVPQFGRYWDGIKLNNAVMKIASDIRYAQSRATTTQQRSRVNFLSATTYEIKYCNSPTYTYNITTCKCPDPADDQWQYAIDPYSRGSFQVDFTPPPPPHAFDDFAGVTISPTSTWLEFDSLGKPSINPCGTLTGTTIIVQNGSSTKTITIATQTGMVQVN